MFQGNSSLQNQTGNNSAGHFLFHLTQTHNHNIRHPLTHPKYFEVVLSEYIISVLGSLFNFMALICVITIPDLKSEKSNIFISSLIFANILLSLKIGVLYAPYDHVHHLEGGCLFIAAATVFTVSASCLSRTAIAVDRYYFICHPLHYQRTTTNLYVTVLIAVQWLTSAVLSFISFLGFCDYRVKEIDEICMPFSRCVLTMSSMVFVIGLSSLTITFIYCQIFYWAYLQITILKQEIIMRATHRSTSLQRYLQTNPMKLRRMTRATDLLVSPVDKVVDTHFTTDMDQAILNESERYRWTLSINRLLSIFYRPSRRLSSLKKIRRLTGGTDVDRSANDKRATVSPRSTLSPRSTTSPHVNASSRVIVSPRVTVNPQNEEKVNTTRSPSPPGPLGPGKRTDETGVEKQEEKEHLPIKAADSQQSRGSTASNVSITEKWYQHELKRYTGHIYNTLFVGASEKRYSRNSSLMIDMLKKSEIKALAVVLITFGAHLLCWLPYMIFSITLIFHDIKLTGSQESVILLVGYACSVADPIIYCLLNRPFRHCVVYYCRQCWYSLEL